ncbi:MAG: M56 family metallopeptidase [Planctomycetaceae bacterium]|nr:M56 family metallopeptidase [Planctomycetaceae bacterium]
MKSSGFTGCSTTSSLNRRRSPLPPNPNGNADMPLADWIIQSTLFAAVLALAVSAACRTRRFVPAVRHALWLIVLIKLVTPPIVALPVSLLPIAWPDFDWAATDFSDSDTIAPEPTALEDDLAPPEFVVAGDSNNFERFVDPGPVTTIEIDLSGMPIDLSALDSTSEAVESSDSFEPSVSPVPNRAAIHGISTTAAPATVSTTPFDIPEYTAAWIVRLMAWGWALGTLIMVVIQGLRLLSLRRLIAGGRDADGELMEIVNAAAQQFGVHPPVVRVVSGLRSPALCAWGRATLLWPGDRLEHMAQAARRAIVLHELAHLRRRDHWVGWLELAAGCGWWWNPLFWYVRHQLHENAELACDAWVVALEPDGRRAYAEALIDVAQGPAVPQLSGVVLGVGDGSRKLLERRLVMIMRGQVRNKIPLIGLVAIALVALVTLPAWSTGEDAPKSAEPVIEAPFDLPMVGAFPTTTPATSPQNSPPLTPSEPDPFSDDAFAAPQAVTNPDVGSPFAPPTPAGATTPGATPAPAAPPAVGPGPTLATPATRSRTPKTLPTPLGRTTDESRLQRVEAQLEAMLAEVKALRRERTSPERRPASSSDLEVTVPSRPSVSSRPPHSAQRSMVKGPVPISIDFFEFTSPSDDAVTVTMIRTTYKLPAGKAESLAKFLREQLSDDVEIKVKAESLQITASEEDQSAVQLLIKLVLRRGRPVDPQPDESADPRIGHAKPAAI